MANDWEPPTSLCPAAGSVPFPIACLPTWVADWIADLGEETQTPVDLAGMMALAVLAATCAKQAVFQVRPGWIEPANLYCLVGLPSGTRKSAVVASSIRPLQEFARSAAEQDREKITRSRAHKAVLEEAARRLANRAAAHPHNDDLVAAAENAAVHRDSYHVLSSPRFFCDDITPEKLGHLMSLHGGRMAMIHAESGSFDMMSGRYNDNASLDLYLKAHANEPIDVDRVKGECFRIAGPALTLGMAIQNDVVRGLAERRGFRGQGLLGRFLYSVPKNMMGHRRIRVDDIRPHVAARYTAHLQQLLATSNLGGDGTEIKSEVLDFDDAAREAVLRFMETLEPRLNPVEDLGAITDWAGKLTGALVRIAGLFHVAERLKFTGRIGEQTTHRALAMSEYFVDHALVAFGLMGADPKIQAAQHILDWICHKRLTEFSKRDVFEGVKGRFNQARELDNPLRLLEEHGYLRQSGSKDRGGPGRKPSPRFEANPSWTRSCVPQGNESRG